MAAALLHPPSPETELRTAVPIALLLTFALGWSFWTTLAAMSQRWANEPQYSHGFLVPVFAAAVLWSRRHLWDQVRWSPSVWGIPVLLGGLALSLAAAASDIEPLDAFSLLPTLAGVVLLAGGVSLFRWTWPAIAFLGFMLPLPYSIETSLALPLRRLATVVSTFALQTMGCPAYAEGNIILLEDQRLGVADACSGLGMLLTFFALSTAMALIVRAALWERLVLVGSAIPIAVVANVIRITATGLAYYAWGPDSQTAYAIMHDFAGWLMMPLALGLLWLELAFLGQIFVEVQEERPLSLLLRK